MKFREKSPERVIADLKSLLAHHPTRLVVMYDNIMPHSYFHTLLPRLDREVPHLHLFYEQKANLTLDQVVALKKAGVAVIQPGIEALSSSLLKRMNKGVTGRQNLALLRYAWAVDLAVNWNILYAFPGDLASEYQETLELLPLLRHLYPPTAVCHLSIDRFSPYFDRPADYGVTNIRPIESYRAILPPQADIWKCSYHFVGDYRSQAQEYPELIQEIKKEVKAWRDAWESPTQAPPVLAVTLLADDTYLLIDSRGLPGTEMFTFTDEETARVVLAGHRGPVTPHVEWALAHKAAVVHDGWVTPLASATPDLIAHFEKTQKQPFEKRVALHMTNN
jgi:ribosomal peptide maturation radical SAM protein 1